jgi:DNA-binding transcriptional LysR family regulator
MNIHHLELFHHVARNKGITAAARNMPYGIQQAAISSQIAQLEESLGVVLFNRRPFALTTQGARLFRFIKPFFDELEPLAEAIRGGVSQHLRIAASEIVLRDFLPAMIQTARKVFPKFKLTMREGYYPEVVKWLEQCEVDVFLGLSEGRPPTGIQSLKLFNLPLVLLVPRDHKLQSARELWDRDLIDETLITIPTNQVICHAFEAGLARRKVDWFSGIEVSTLSLAEIYVEKGYGLAVTVGIPRHEFRPEVRALPLEGFPKVAYTLLWQGVKTPVLDHFIKVVQATVDKLSVQE